MAPIPFLFDLPPEALARLDWPAELPRNLAACILTSWLQTWPSGAGGVKLPPGSVTTCALVTTPTITVEGPLGDVLVLHSGEVVRHVRHPTAAFRAACARQELPAEGGDWTGLDDA